MVGVWSLRRLGVLTLAFALVLSLVSVAWAVRIYGASRPGNQSGSEDSFLDLGRSLDGSIIGDALPFTVRRRGLGIITFTGACSVEGSVNDYVSIDILVNGVAVGQSNGPSDAFCSGNDTSTSADGGLMASMSVPFEFAPGNVDLQIMVTLEGATHWRIGDTGVSVILQKR